MAPERICAMVEVNASSATSCNLASTVSDVLPVVPRRFRQHVRDVAVAVDGDRPPPGYRVQHVLQRGLQPALCRRYRG